MKEGAPPLMPILRSRVQAEVLSAVLLDADREWTLTELARLVRASVATVQREVKRSEGAGIVRSRRLGNTRLVRANPASELTAPMTELLLRSFGPKQVLTESLRDVPGIDAAYLFGSWAARYEGEQGFAPRDIDVLVIGRPDRDVLDQAIAISESRLSRRIDVTIRNRIWWDAGTDPFHSEISKRPVVTLIGLDDGQEAG